MTVKSRLLELLEQNKGESISGESAAEQLHCTRAAIWKAVKTLREEGYQIEAAQNRGYCLSAENNRLSEEAIRLYLGDSNAELRLLDQVDSTNREARRLIAAGEGSHGFAVLARRQNAGRGRRGREFFSPEGGIYLSVILRPQTTLLQSLLLTTSAATAVYKAVKEVCGIDLSIKWVNDLYLDQKKVCGILTEAITDFETGDIDYAIVGIGLNVQGRAAELPEELRTIAGFLTEDASIDCNRLAAAIITYLLEETAHPVISPLYISRNMIPGHEIRITDGERSRRAFAQSITERGTLLVTEEDGRTTELTFGEVSVLPTELAQEKNT